MEPPNDSREHRLWIGAADVDGMLGGGLDATLAAWMEHAMVDEAASARARRHWLTVQAEATSSLTGVLVDLGERGRPVVVAVDDRAVPGHIVGIGADFVVLSRHDGRAVIIPTAAIGIVRSADDVAVWGDRDVRVDTTLAGIVGPVAADHPEVTVWTTAGSINGVLASAGIDVVRVRLDNGTSTWVALGAIRALVLN